MDITDRPSTTANTTSRNMSTSPGSAMMQQNVRPSPHMEASVGFDDIVSPHGQVSADNSNIYVRWISPASQTRAWILLLKTCRPILVQQQPSTMFRPIQARAPPLFSSLALWVAFSKFPATLLVYIGFGSHRVIQRRVRRQFRAQRSPLQTNNDSAEQHHHNCNHLSPLSRARTRASGSDLDRRILCGWWRRLGSETS